MGKGLEGAQHHLTYWAANLLIVAAVDWTAVALLASRATLQAAAVRARDCHQVVV